MLLPLNLPLYGQAPLVVFKAPGPIWEKQRSKMLTGQSPVNQLSDQTAIINEMVLYSIIATEL